MNNKIKFLSISFAKGIDIFQFSLFNLISIPLIIEHWGAEGFTAWILFFTITGYLFIYNTSLIEFTYSENLKKGFKKKDAIFSEIINSSIVSFLITLFLILIVYIEFKFKFFLIFSKLDLKIYEDLILALLIYTCFSSLTNNILPFFTNSLNIFGYQNFFSWLRVAENLAFYMTVIFFLFLDKTFFSTVMYVILIRFLFHLIKFFYVAKFIKLEKFKLKNLNFLGGLLFLIRSNWLVINNLVENFLNTGVRFIIIFIGNPIMLTIFIPIRTIANLFRQSIEIVREPLLPNLMHNAVNYKYDKFNDTFKFYYIFLIILFIPTITIFNYFVEDIYLLWIGYDAMFNLNLYLFLILSVTINALIIPYKLIITGFNLNKTKLIINLFAILFLIIFVVYFYNKYFILSFGIGLFISEFVIAISSFIFANKFSKENKININNRFFYLTIIVILVAIFVNFNMLFF